MLRLIFVTACAVFVSMAAPQLGFGNKPLNFLGLQPSIINPVRVLARALPVQPVRQRPPLRRQYQQQPQRQGEFTGDGSDGVVPPRPYGSDANSQSQSAGAGFGPFGPLYGAGSSSATSSGNARGRANGTGYGSGYGNGIYAGDSAGNSNTNSDTISNAATGSQTIVGDGYVANANYGSSSSTSNSNASNNVVNRIRGKK